MTSVSLKSIDLRRRISTKLVSLVGKTLAFTNIKFTNPKGDIVARGSHTK